MKTLALDTATRTGWAFADSETYPLLMPLQANVDEPPQPQSGVVEFRAGADPEALGQYFFSFSSWLEKMCANFEIECLVFEQPFAGPKTHQATTRKLFGMAAEVERRAHILMAPCFQSLIPDIRKHFLGFTGARETMKNAVIDACRYRGWEVTDDNEADALAVLDHFMHCLAPRAGAERAAATL